MTRPAGRWRNWGRSAAVTPQRVEFPRTVGAVRRAVQAADGAGLRIKAVGAGHSFSAIAAAPGVLLDLRDLDGLVSVDPARARVTLLAGTRLHRLPRLLRPYGLAIENLGDIAAQSISGAISTGTHGTGTGFGGLATRVVGVKLVTVGGDLLVVDEAHNTDLLPAVAVGLGALGVLVEVTLQCVPAFTLHAVERPEPLQEVLADVRARADAADHFEFFWFPHTDLAMTKTNTRLPDDAQRHPIAPATRWIQDELVGSGLHQVACSVGRAVPPLVPPINRASVRLWGNREFTDASERVFTTVRRVRFREMEYAIAVERIVETFAAIRALVADSRWRISFPVELRFAAADDLWLSTAYGRETAYIAVHRYWREDPTEYFDAVEEILVQAQGRPHWGKLHTLDAETLRERYPRFDDFLAVRERLDPNRRFANAYLDRVLGG